MTSLKKIRSAVLSLALAVLGGSTLTPAVAQPANDAFTNAWVLTGANVTTNGSSLNSSKEANEPNHAFNQGGRSVWFSWIAPKSGQVRIDTLGSSFNTLLGVYTGTSVTALSVIATNNDAPGFGNLSMVEFLAVQGTTYRIVVDANRNFFGTPAGGDYVVNLETLASVVITSPTNNSVIYVGAPFSIEVEAEVANVPISRVDFYRAGSVLLGSDATAPYNLSVTSPFLGTNLITAVAVDLFERGWTSSVTRVAVLNLGVTIVSPLNGTVLQSTGAVPVSVVVSLPSGTITNVEFQADEQRFANDTTAPFTASWGYPAGGVHRLTAIGTDNSGLSYTSSPVVISTPRVFFPTGSVWKYLDTGANLGTNWVARDFNDSSWPSGPGQFGYGDGDEATLISFGPELENKHITTYFRREFTINRVSEYTNIILNVRRDDGAVIYLNGFEIQRMSMPSGTITHLTPGLTSGDDGLVLYPVNTNASLLVEGRNVLAVEVHQDSGEGDDLSFDLQLNAVHYPRNLPPSVALTEPVPLTSFIAPPQVILRAQAADPEGAVSKVAFYANGVLLGEDATEPFEFTWLNPPTGRHQLRVIATDDFGTQGGSALSEIRVYDSVQTPLVQITTPGNGTVVEGPTNMLIAVDAVSLNGIANVQFLVNGLSIANDMNAPYSTVWNAPFGTNTLAAVATAGNGSRGTSALVTVTITIPPTNTVAPTITARNPVAGATITSLTSVRVTFSERVSGVDASDLLLNGIPAAQVTNNNNLYIFTVFQPPQGTINITWAPDHGIQDFGYPSSLPFNENGPGATWTYNLVDRTAPVITATIPPAGAFLTNLSEVTVSFSEVVSGVDAADFLINGVSAFGVNQSGTNYTFSFSQPPSGPVNISWAATHNIADFAAPPNAFNATGAGATWSYTLDSRTILVQSNSTWLYFEGLTEASVPNDAWRQLAFNDDAWSTGLAPFYFGDPYGTVANPGTLLDNMPGNYTSLYLRRPFNLASAGAITNLFLGAQSDDGFIAWINGVEVARSTTMAQGNIPYNGTATGTATEPNQNGAAYLAYALPNPGTYLVDGENILTVHAFNQSTNSGDFGFNAQLYTFLADPKVVAPRITGVTPPAGTLFYLTNLTVRFLEPVTGVNATDLLINGTGASSVSGGTSNATYTFTFTQPNYGPVQITWASGHGIVDFDSPPKPFDGAAASLQYSLLNPKTPTIVSQNPQPNTTINHLTQLGITFSKPVTGVTANDLLVGGIAATNVTGSGANYTFTFPQPPYGNVSIGWAENHGITDLEAPVTPFDPTRQGSSWSYVLLDQTSPSVLAVQPTPGTQVQNLTGITVTFSEPVAGVNAGDLRINGVPALNAAGGPQVYTFSFAQPNATVVEITWVASHGIRDLAPVPNSFDVTAPGSTWSYTTFDNIAPAVAQLNPPAGATIRSFSQISVLFTENVTGVTTNDLIVNNRAALAVNGSGAGPYTFNFLPPSNGVLNVRWDAAHGIADLAAPPNPFPGGQWTYTLDPNATFAGKIVINEIMFNSRNGQPAEEWIELRNLTANPISLAGWQFSRGIGFTFGDVAIAANGYLVVAANLEAFQARYPSVANVVGGWTGRLANSDETIELTSALGEAVNSVHYASQGDWARRERGNGADPADAITGSGTTATVSIFGHGFTQGDQVIISGADQPEYNGRFTINNVQPSSFNVALGSAVTESPATGNIIVRLVVDDSGTGWSWFNPADGYGHTLELINPTLPNSSGQNWQASANPNGTPGEINSGAAGNIAPLLSDITHFPFVPHASETVSITARVRDESSNGVASVMLFYRNHTSTTPGPFVSTNMFDDGTHSDGSNRDGLFGARLPAMPNGTIMEFYVQATDTSGLSRTWPAPTWDTNNTFAQLANALYQVDDEVITNLVPAMRVIMTATEDALFPPGDRDTDAGRNTTLVSIDGDGTKVRYLCSVRIRGAGSRGQPVPNNRLNIPNDNRWNGYAAVNLNGQYVHAQISGATFARKAGLPASAARIIQYRINGVNPAPLTAPGGGGFGGAGYGSFVMVEPVNGDLAENLFPEDGGGNVYRASVGNHSAQLNYLQTNPNNYLQAGYFKTSNQSINDWSDLINLTFIFSQTNAPLTDYLQGMSTNVNAEFWMRYFAVGTLMNYTETSLFNGRGDDYALYRGEKDPRFVPIGHDFDTVFGQGDTTDAYASLTGSSIYIMLNPPNTGGGGFGGNPPNMPVLRRFMTNEAFAPIFFAELKRLADTVFSPSEINSTMDQILTGWGNGPSVVTINAMKNHAINRRASVLSQIPLNLTVGHNLSTSGGFAFTTTPSVLLFGNFHAIDTRKVLVNGVSAHRSHWDARWTNTITLQPGINRVLVQSLNSNEVEFARTTLDVWYDDGTVQQVSGAITTDTVWNAAEGPYQVTGSVTVNNGVTLTILPGTTVFFGAGVNLTVNNGGRLLAEGSDAARIRFTRVVGAGNWGGITVNGSIGSPETRIAYAHIDGNSSTAIRALAGTVFLDHVSFGNTAVRYLDLDGASFVVQDCHFPSSTAAFEPIHANQGIRSDGRGLFLRNFMGKTIGYNDSIDFTGGNRPGPIIQVIDNVFMGSDDDILDFDSTDAWVEGNIFLHVHRNGSPDSASAISGGADNADTSQITIVGNLFYDIDQVANAKQGNFYTFLNNTVVSQNRNGSQDLETGVITMADEGTALGLGFYLEGNIISEAERLVRTQGVAQVTFTNNLFHQVGGPAWTGPGGGNTTADPLLKYIPQLSETTNFNSYASAQVFWDWFSLQPGSLAAGTGPNGRDKGGVVPGGRGFRGISISGEPQGTTPANSATLTVGTLRTGNGIPTAGFPNGSGFTHYRWRLDGGAWSAETSIATPITLSSLSPGPHFVEVSGRNDAGFYQDDPAFGATALLTVSKTWTVNPNASPIRINEVLAANGGSVSHNGTPDAIELYNTSGSAVNLAGLRLTDDPQTPDKFIFPSGASIPARGYLVVYANNDLSHGPGDYHLGFNLNQEGDAVYLFDSGLSGGELLDSVVFGLQVTDLSIARLGDGQWTLGQPTFGAANRAAQIGDPNALLINEWLAIGTAPFSDDFIELYNSSPLPVALGGLYLTDELIGNPARHQIPALSFIRGFGYQAFIADGNPDAGATHVDFNLNGDFGEIGLMRPNLTAIDCVYYQGQRLNVSQGRSPNGSTVIAFFDNPTPGGPNPLITTTPTGGALVINEVLANNASLVESGRTPDWVEIYNGTTGTLELGGMILSDSSQQLNRFIIPSNTMIAPAGFVRIVCDPNGVASSPLHTTNFALRSAGGSVYLFDRPASGGTPLSVITYGIQTPDLSIGRVPDGTTNWVLNLPTPLGPNAAVTTLGSPSTLRVNEWLANPVSGENDWLEIYNSGTLPVALGGLWLTDDLNTRQKHRIAPLSFIGTGTNAWQRFIANGTTGPEADRVGFSLRAEDEDVGISQANGTLIDGYAFSNQEEGVSEGRFPDGNTNAIRFPGTASPGAPNWRWLAQIAINEVLTHTDLPLEDAIELRNLTAQPIDVGGWWLSDDPGTLRKYQIPAPTVIPANGFTVIYETVFTNDAFAVIPFALSSHGDEVVLSSATNNTLTGFRTRVDFGAADNGVSFGRYLTSDQREQFVALSGRSFGVDDPDDVENFRQGQGLPNLTPRVGPIVISEIMYHPPDVGLQDNVGHEYVQLQNITTAPVALYDPAFPTNRWRLRDAVDFDFPTGTTLEAGESLLVVSFDPVNNIPALNSFRNRYNLSSSTRILGPYSGKLANDTDDIELRKPSAPDEEGVDSILVERVRFSDLAPWPAGADGTGLSLHRKSINEFGNDPANWLADAPTPGPAASNLDTDGDGMPDDWERDYSFDWLNPADAAFDSDGDGLTNLQEYQMGTNPRNPASGLNFTIRVHPNGSSLILSFTAVAGFSYSIEQSDSLTTPNWRSFQDFAAAPTTGLVEVTVSATGPSRFFRLRTPTRPAEPATLRINSITRQGPGQFALSFDVPANLPCAVEFKTNLTPGAWSTATNYTAVSTNRVIQLLVPANPSGGFYRLRTP